MTDPQDEIDRYQQTRENFLAVLLACLLGGGMVVFLIFVSGGFFFWVILISGALGVLGSLHYLVWGRSFSREVQAERERLRRQEAVAAQGVVRPPWERRF